MKSVLRSRVGILGLAAMVVVCVSVTQAPAEKVAMKDLPGAVRAAAERAIAGGSLKRIVLEQEDGQDAYSVEARIAGKNKEFTFASDGTLLAEEEDVAFAQLPDSVRAAAEKYFGGSSGLHASMEIEKGVTFYEVEGRRSGEEMSVKLSADGALLEEEKDED